ncbi:MAG: glycoside hydrolase family 30 protein [Planctomycetes bacterium]|nr:glycoside hydrolase family 30 protein [Planctomycetota bacterium]
MKFRDCFAIIPILAAALAAQAGEPVKLKLDPKTAYQTWEAWSCIPTPGGFPFEEWLKSPTLETLDKLAVNKDLPLKLIARQHDSLVFDVGITRMRLEVGPQIKLENNDKAWRFAWQDHKVETHILPMKKRIESIGEKMVLYISYDLRSKLTPAFLLEPDNYAEMAVTFLKHLKEKYGIEPDYWSVLNEPGNQRPGDPKLCAQLTAATGAKIAKAGFRTKMSGPECVTVAQIPKYMEAMKSTPGALDNFRQITYHLYHGGCNNVEARNATRDWAKKFGVTTAQTEWMEQDNMNVARHIYLCLAEADAAVWDRYGTGLFYTFKYNEWMAPASDSKELALNSTGWHIRQFSHYIRPGAVRVKLEGETNEVKGVAFLTPQKKKPVIVLLNTSDQPQTVTIDNLSAGTYEASVTSVPEKAFGKALAPIQVADGGSLKADLPPQSVSTFTADPPSFKPASSTQKADAPTSTSVHRN